MGDEDTKPVAGDGVQVSTRTDLPAEDLQQMVKLYQKCPKLWGCFNHIVQLVDLMTTHTDPGLLLIKGLKRVKAHVDAFRAQEADICLFLAVSGFVEKSVALARQLLREMGKTYITEFPDARDSEVGMICVNMIRSQMMNSTSESSEFALRLTRTGYIEDLVEDLKHIQHLTVEALKSGDVFLSSLGTIHNCCIYPESLAAVRKLNIIPHLTPFLTKRGKSKMVRSVTTAVVARLVEDDDPGGLLAVDCELVQYFMKHVQAAVDQGLVYHSYWCVREVLVDLHLLARNDSNKRLMVAQGLLGTLSCVLEPSKKRSDVEVQHTVNTISRLLEDHANLLICQSWQEVRDGLHVVAEGGDCQTAEDARRLLDTLDTCSREEDLDARLAAFPQAGGLLAEQRNLLPILRMGLVEFVLEELTHLTKQVAPAPGDSQAPCRPVLKALAELAADDVFCREILARGGLCGVGRVLEAGCREDQAEAARVVLTLTRTPENRAVLQNNSGLTTLLESLQQRADNPDLSQLADDILLALLQ